jgi:anti-sigma factor RsiW
MNHPTAQELLEYADRTLRADRAAEVAAHLGMCPGCARAHEVHALMDGALRRLPVERPSADFHRKLLLRLGLRESPPLWWLFLRNFAPILTAGVVAIVVMALGSAPPAGGGGPAPQSLFDAGRAMVVVQGAVEAFTSCTRAVVSQYLTFSVGKDSMSLTLLLCALLGAVGLLDRYLIAPIFRRRP